MHEGDEGGFEGEFTIVNHGSTAINGWELSAVLPGDQIEAVWQASYHTAGDSLIIDPAADQTTIAPGASLTVHLIASGTTTSPTSCTFNGSPC